MLTALLLLLPPDAVAAPLAACTSPYVSTWLERSAAWPEPEVSLPYTATTGAHTYDITGTPYLASAYPTTAREEAWMHARAKYELGRFSLTVAGWLDPVYVYDDTAPEGVYSMDAAANGTAGSRTAPRWLGIVQLGTTWDVEHGTLLVDTGARPGALLTGVFAYDIDDNGFMDYLLTLSDGTVWDQAGPVAQGQVVHVP